MSLDIQIQEPNPSSDILLIQDEIYGQLEARKLSNGLTVMAASEHSYVMEDGTSVSANAALSRILISIPVERVVGQQGGVQFVEPEFEPNKEGVEWLDRFSSEHPNVLIATSMINLNTFKHPTLVTFIATNETKRVINPQEKRWQLNKVARIMEPNS